jgi:hypothetical protein
MFTPAMRVRKTHALNGCRLVLRALRAAPEGYLYEFGNCAACGVCRRQNGGC